MNRDDFVKSRDDVKQVCTLELKTDIFRDNFIKCKLQDEIDQEFIWCLVDTGARINLIKESVWHTLSSKPPITKDSTSVVTATGTAVSILGKANLSKWLKPTSKIYLRWIQCVYAGRR